MYSIRETYKGGEFKSSVTGKVYRYSIDPDGKSKRDAFATMQKEEVVYRDAEGARRAITPPSPPVSIRDQIKGTGPTASDKLDGMQRYVIELRSQLACCNPGERMRLERRIAVHEQSIQRELANRETKAAADAWHSRPELVKAKGEAKQWLESLATRSDLDQATFEDIQSAVEALEDTGDLVTWAAQKAELTSRYEAFKAGKIAEMNAAIAEQQKMLDDFKGGYLPPPETNGV